MIKNIFILFSIMFIIPNLNASSVRLDGMGGLDIAVEDIESEMSENPARWLDFSNPAIIFNGLYGENDYFQDWDELINDWGYIHLIPSRSYKFTRKLEGYALCPIKNGVFGLGYTDCFNKYGYWHWVINSDDFNNGISYEYSGSHYPLICAGIKVKSINIGIMAKFSENTPLISKSVIYKHDSAFFNSDTFDVPNSDYYYILGITTNAFKNTYISANIEYNEKKGIEDWETLFYTKHNVYSTKLNLLVRRKLTNWLTLGTKTYCKYLCSWTNPYGIFKKDSDWYGGRMPLGIAISPDNRTIIGIDVYDLIHITNDYVRLKWPQIIIGGERLIEPFALRCGLEVCQEYHGWEDYFFNPKVGFGYHLTNKLNLDLTMEPMDWYPWQLSLQYKF